MPPFDARIIEQIGGLPAQHAATYDRRFSVLHRARPATDDRVSPGGPNQRFCKIATWLQEDHMKCVGVRARPIELVPAILDAERTRELRAAIEPFETFKVLVHDISDLIGLTMPVLQDAAPSEQLPLGTTGVDTC